MNTTTNPKLYGSIRTIPFGKFSGLMGLWITPEEVVKSLPLDKLMEMKEVINQLPVIFDITAAGNELDQFMTTMAILSNTAPNLVIVIHKATKMQRVLTMPKLHLVHVINDTDWTGMPCSEAHITLTKDEFQFFPYPFAAPIYIYPQKTISPEVLNQYLRSGMLLGFSTSRTFALNLPGSKQSELLDGNFKPSDITEEIKVEDKPVEKKKYTFKK